MIDKTRKYIKIVGMGTPKNKKIIPIVEATKLRYCKGLTYKQIGERFGVRASSVARAMKKLANIFPSMAEAEVYRQNRAGVLNAVEMRIVQELSNEDKIKAASLNNCAYTLQQIHGARRLEENKSTSNVDVRISIEQEELARRVVDAIFLEHSASGDSHSHVQPQAQTDFDSRAQV